MDGDNQYLCSNCECKRNAKRSTKLTRLPPVLNLQLLRFVYDRNSGYKKKLATRIKFYDTIDLSSYTKSEKSRNETTIATSSPKIRDKEAINSKQDVYHLGAILMHVGKTAYSGHYMAQIKDFEKNEWYNFNDESITKLKRKNQLGCTEEEAESKQTLSQNNDEQTSESQSSTSNKKVFQTANAYLLVYYRADIVNKMPCKEESMKKKSNQSECVEMDNANLEKWYEKLYAHQTDQNDNKNTLRAITFSVYQSLWPNGEVNSNGKCDDAAVGSKGKRTRQPQLKETESSSSLLTIASATSSSTSEKSPKQNKSQPLYYLTTDFLRKWLTSPNTICSNELASLNSVQKYICPHKRLNPLAVNRFKLISKLGLDRILDIYSIKINDLNAFEAYNDEVTRCWECVTNCYEYLKCKEKLKQDAKILRNLLKNDSENNEYNQNPNAPVELISRSSRANSGSETDTCPSSRTSIYNLKVKTDEILSNEGQNQKNKTLESKFKEEVLIIDKEEFHNSKEAELIHSKSPLSKIDKAIKSKECAMNGDISNDDKCLLSPKANNSKIFSPKLNKSTQNYGSLNGSSSQQRTTENKENANVAIHSKNAAYWVGKESLRVWQSLAIKKYESLLPPLKFNDAIDAISCSNGNNNTNPALSTNDPANNSCQQKQEQTTDDIHSIQEITNTQQLVNNNTNNQESNKNSPKASNNGASNSDDQQLQLFADFDNPNVNLTYFNEDITCIHNNLLPTPNKRLISSNIWHQIFEHYFRESTNVNKTVNGSNRPHSIFTSDCKECMICLVIN
jgi:hypothetical protein